MNGGFEILPYEPSMKDEWDHFVENSKNGTFLFKRDYMEYHSDRFTDNSLVILHKNNIYSLLPASKTGNTISSHAGLTYGGLILNNNATVAGILDLMKVLAERFKKDGMSDWIYKPVPHIYHKIPAEEDLYALFRLNADLIVRNVSSTIGFSASADFKLPFRQLRTRGVKKALKEGITIQKETVFKDFWEILENNLQTKYHTHPVHSLSEIEILANNFPENIQLFTAVKDEQTLAGTLCYLCNETVHCQYISASPKGKESGALDLLFSRLIQHFSSTMRYFDFGTSNEEQGRYLNEPLIFFKEGFGARALCYDTYAIKL